MSRIFGYTQDFLDEIGYSLGYDEKNLPEFKDIEMVWRFNIPVWEYNGLTEAEFYKSNWRKEGY